MGIRSGSTCADPVFGEQKKPLWDPFATLEIINPARGSFTCVGHAPSKRRRCQNPIARHNRDAASNILDSIAQASANSKALESKLRELARVSLCLAYHQNQVDTVVAQWQWKIRSMCPHPLEEAQPDSCEMERQEREREALEWLRHWAQQIHEVLKRQQKERQDKERQEKERQEQERQEQERQEKERQEQERQEKERQEKERQEKEQQEREQKAREQETRNERLRRSAQQLREERERKAREEAEKERKEWDQAWENYVKRWNDFKGKVSTSPSPVLLRTSPVAEAKSTTENPREAIPWPVKSGRQKDLTASNVESFFRMAPTKANSPGITFKMMQAESLKWHPDKITGLFRGTTPTDADRMIINMICKVVIRLRAEARDRRSS